MRRDFSHPCVWTALQVILINRNAPDSPLEYSPFASESSGLSSYDNLFHAFNMLQFGQLYQLGNEGHKKIIDFNKITLNVIIHFIRIFNNIWQKRRTIMLKNTIKLFLNNVSIRHYIFHWWNDFIRNIFLSVLKILHFLTKYQFLLIFNCFSVSPSHQTSLIPTIKVCPCSVTTSYVP